MIIDKNMKITSVHSCIEVEYECGFGGGSKNVYIGELIHIETKYGTNYTGIVKGYELATTEGMQDCILVENQDGETKKVGIYDIIIMERPI